MTRCGVILLRITTRSPSQYVRADAADTLPADVRHTARVYRGHMFSQEDIAAAEASGEVHRLDAAAAVQWLVESALDDIAAHDLDPPSSSAPVFCSPARSLRCARR